MYSMKWIIFLILWRVFQWSKFIIPINSVRYLQHEGQELRKEESLLSVV
jgi:hypothetical protein